MINHQNTRTMWKFSSIDNIEESNFNKTLERFLGMGINGLTRENIQNSLDGRLINSNEPVIVKIQTGKMNQNDVPNIKEVKKRIDALEGRNNYARESIVHMKNQLDQEKVRYISFEDINTRGLTGARNGQSNSKEDTWGIYAYNKGVHFEEENSDREIARGGSHGIGKIASNAASDLNVMYFANCDVSGDQHLGGTVQLIEHFYEGQAYRSTGYFTDIEKMDNQNISKFYPYENDFHEVFRKDTRGLKIVIPFLRKEYENEIDIIKSVCDSFFIAILENRLEVEVNDKKITKNTILDYLKNPYYYEQDITEIRKEFTPLYVNSYLNQSPKEIVVNNKVDDFKFKLYFTYDEKIPRGRVAVFRTIGMKIEDLKITSYVMKPFNAVLIGGSKEDEYLKSLENESHTELSADNFNDPELNSRATRFIRNLSKEVARIIDEAINEHNPVDGQMKTDDILYVVETQLKKDLEKSMGTVRIKEDKELVKTSGKEFKKEKRDKGKGPENKDNEKELPKSTENRNPLKLQKGDRKTEDEQEESKERYSAHPEMVERIILQNKEMIKFDFTKSDQLKNVTSCDISLSIIDGMGIEYKDEFNLNESYQQIYDVNKEESCNFKKDSIKNVQIKDGIAQLQLKLKDTFNKSLKFIYYVEV